MIFFWGGAQSRPLHPTPLDTYSTLPLLTEILNTPLIVYVSEMAQAAVSCVLFSLFLLILFLSRVSILTRDIDIANPSVCPSLRNVPVSDENGLAYRHSFFTIRFRNFLQISRYISQTIKDIAIVTMEGE